MTRRWATLRLVPLATSSMLQPHPSRIVAPDAETCANATAAEPRLLARFDGAAGRWRIAAGTYRVAVGRSAVDLDLTAEATLTEALFGC